ncbi:hypothetical protein RF55_16196 [Lasius niger]|uniref:Uncharacterized protein n=1 Tax=Lasius niger TaxID=67767 RepID=A0A0J7K554_LASNI|nr:hypothetical protein RF55_16196 [Lasius niger]
MTGGGNPSTIPNDPVMDFMDAATPNLEVQCPFDSTTEFEKECHIQRNSLEKEFIISDKEKENLSSQVSKKFDIPKSINTKKIKSNSNDVVNISRSVKRNQNSKAALQPDIIDNELETVREKELRLIKLRETIKQQRELHTVKLKIVDTELKLALLKLSLTEENVQSVVSVIAN